MFDPVYTKEQMKRPMLYEDILTLRNALELIYALK